MNKYVAIIIVILLIIGIVWASNSRPQKDASNTVLPAITTTEKTMTIETTVPGTGEAIVNGKIAVMEYTGMLADGSVFDATSLHGNVPFEFVLGQGMVIQGWEQGVLGMKIGEERTLVIPPELAYGAAGFPPVIPQNATLTFKIKLLAIK